LIINCVKFKVTQQFFNGLTILVTAGSETAGMVF
jgi:hypothetical protein